MLSLALVGLVVVAVAVAVTMALHAGARRLDRLEQGSRRQERVSSPRLVPPYEALFVPADELLSRPSRPSQEPCSLDDADSPGR